MPDLIKSLHQYDLGFLRIVAQLWGVELEGGDVRQAAPNLASALRDPELVAEVIEALPSQASAALQDLLKNDGRLTWVRFARRYGEVREMGPGRRDREKPYQQPVSPAEALWYRALVARSFFDSPSGPEEFAYIPDDLIPHLPFKARPAVRPLGRAASAAEVARPLLVDDRILDHACTLLAALRIDQPEEIYAPQGSFFAEGAAGIEPFPLSTQALKALLAAAGLLTEAGAPESEPARRFLEAGRGEALAMLAHAWLDSPDFDELNLVPGLLLEGEWEHEPLRARRAVLRFLESIPKGKWWRLTAFVQAVHTLEPDFQRPAGDYDSWFIRSEETGEYLRGFENWEAVDGALLRYVIAGPMHWLGLIDLAGPAGTGAVAAFRTSRWWGDLIEGRPPPAAPEGDRPVVARSDARLSVPRLAPRAARYQIARFGRWEKPEAETYTYTLTPASLARARDAGLQPGHLLGLLGHYAQAVPPSLVKALENWSEKGVQAKVGDLLVLRVSSPQILQDLRATRAARFLGDPLGPTAVIVKPGAWNKVLAALAEMGYLGEGEGLS